MKKHFSSFVLFLLVFSLFIPIYSMAQTGALKLRLMTETGDMITSNQPIIKNFFLSSDGVLSAILDSSQGGLNFTFDTTVEAHIGIRNIDQSCTISNYVVSAVVGNLFQFEVYSTNATVSQVSLPGGSFSSGIYQWTTAASDIGTWLAVFQATGTNLKNSQIVVMIKVNPAESVSAPSLSGPTSGYATQSYSFTASGSTVNPSGDPVQYNFNWGDGTESGWLPVGTTSASHSWTNNSTYNVTVTARCATHTNVISTSSNTVSIVISTAPVITYTLTVNTSGSGSVAKNPDKTAYASGESVQLTATPGTGYTFSSWSGSVTGSTNPVTITMDGNKTLTATFTSTNPPSGEVLTWGTEVGVSVPAGTTKTYTLSVTSSTLTGLILQISASSSETLATYTLTLSDGREFPTLLGSNNRLEGMLSNTYLYLRSQRNPSGGNITGDYLPVGSYILKLNAINTSSLNVRANSIQ